MIRIYFWHNVTLFVDVNPDVSPGDQVNDRSKHRYDRSFFFFRERLSMMW